MGYSSAYITSTKAEIQTMHSNFSNELCNFLKRKSGRDLNIHRLISINNIIGVIVNILTDYTAYGNTTINNTYNGLTETELKALIDYSYRILNKYSFNIYALNYPNIYL